MKNARPPRWARVLASLLVRSANREFVLGDLEEMYAGSGSSRGLAIARYLAWALRTAVTEAAEVARAGILLDLIVALRQLRRRPRVYLGSAVVLSVGLGVSTLTWGVRYGSVGRDLPVSAPDRVLSAQTADVRTRAPSGVSIDDARRMREVAGVDAIGLWGDRAVNLTFVGRPAVEVSAMAVTPDLFRILEIAPLHGRLLLDSDGAPGAPSVAVLGYAHWTSQFDADPGVVGRSVRLDGVPTEIVGILPEGKGITAHEALWLPAGADEDPTARAFEALLRISAGVDRSAVDAALGAMADRAAEAGDPAWLGRAAVTLTLNQRYSGRVDTVRDRVLGLGGILLFVMAVANVANLFLVATRARAHELAIRRALGSGRLKVLRQLVIEASIPAALGFFGAALIASLALDFYQVASNNYGAGFVWQVYRLELAHLWVLALGSIVSTVCVSAVSAFREVTGDGTWALKGGRTVGPGFAVGRVLLGVEVAVGCALLLVASLMMRSGWNLRSVDFDFATTDVMTGDLTLRGPAYAEPDARVAFWDRLQVALAGLDGVAVASVGAQLPLIRCCNNRFRVEVGGFGWDDPAVLPVHYVNGVGPGYFETFDVAPVSGRAFHATDDAAGEPVAMVNTHFARLYFAGSSPIGRALRIWRGDEAGPWRRIVGVAPHLWMDTDVNERPEGVYVPIAQMAPARASFAVRVRGAPADYAPALRETVAALDGELAVNDLRSMPQLFRDRTSLYRREGPLFTFLGLAALALAVAGLYAAVSYLASVRTRELGLRSALGAGRTALMRGSVAGVVSPTGIGAVAGLFVGLGLTRGFDRFVFLVDPWSPAVAAATLILLAGSAGLASLGPALRAARVDPALVLRED